MALDPQAARERAGCVTFFPLFVVALVVPGCLGFLVGELLAPVLNMPALGFQLGFLAAFDGLAIAVLFYWRTVGGATARSVLAPSFMLVMFAAIGIRCGGGPGIIRLLVWGIANGAFGLLAALHLLRATEPPTDGH